MVICRFTATYTHAYTCRMNHNDTIIKQTSEDFLKQICNLSLYCKCSKRVTQGLRVRVSW